MTDKSRHSLGKEGPTAAREAGPGVRTDGRAIQAFYIRESAYGSAWKGQLHPDGAHCAHYSPWHA
jgi:hypothetical protein